MTFRAPSAAGTGNLMSRSMTPPSVRGAEHAAHGALNPGLGTWALSRVAQEHVVQGRLRLFDRGDTDALGLEQPEDRRHAGARVVDVDDQRIARPSGLNTGDVLAGGQRS